MTNLQNAGQFLDFLTNQIEDGSNPARAHRNMCRALVEPHGHEHEWTRNAASNNINLLRDFQQEADIRTISYEILEQVYEEQDRNCCCRSSRSATRALIKRNFVSAPLSDLRRWAYTLITSYVDQTGAHPFKTIAVLVGNLEIRISLSGNDGTPSLVIVYRQSPYGCTINYRENDQQEVTEHAYGLSFQDLAANELVQILEYSMAEGNNAPRVPLSRLQFNIQSPFDATNPPNTNFQRKVRRVIEHQRRRVISTEEFSMQVYRCQDERNQLFDLAHIRPVFLKHITAVLWDDDQDRYRGAGVTMLQKWTQMAQYAQCTRVPHMPEEVTQNDVAPDV